MSNKKKKNTKIFITFDDQIDYLKNKKNLIIDDEKYAREMLKRTCYYSLIVGYREIFKDKDTENYRDGTSFEDIVRLYHFDEELRAVFLEYIFKVEDQIRSLVSYYFSEKHGEKQSEYLNPANYNVTNRNRHEVDMLIRILTNLACKSTEYETINHAREKHGNVPLWILVTAMTFGNIYKMYSFVTSDIKNKVANAYISLSPDELEQLLAVISKFRNVCAHRERLFTYHANKTIPDMPIHEELGIEKKEDGEYKYGKNKLYSVVIAFYYLLPEEVFMEFRSKLCILLNKYLIIEKIYPESELLDIIGFPPNWHEI